LNQLSASSEPTGVLPLTLFSDISSCDYILIFLLKVLPWKLKECIVDGILFEQISRKWTHHVTTLLFFVFGIWSLWEGFKEDGY
jgi:hypothetical protein